MSSFAERYREEGVQQGIQKGMQKGVQQGEAADPETLLKWSDKILSANSVEDVLH